MTLAEERDYVFAKKPLLGKLYHEYKDRYWPAYLKDIDDKLPKTTAKVYEDRFSELAGACEAIALPLFGTMLTHKIISTLKSKRFVSTSDHHGLLCHSFFLNFNLLRATSPPDEPVISLTCGGTSFSNSSYPRGLLFHDSILKLIKIPLVPWKYRRTSVYGHAALTNDDFDRHSEHIESLSLPVQQKNKLSQLFENFSENKLIQKSTTFSQQASVMTHQLWQAAGMHEDVVYLECESIVRDLLLDIHLSRDTAIHRILFDYAYRDAYLTHFKGVTGAHCTGGGTELFWYRDREKNKKIKLKVGTSKGHAVLKSDDGTVTIPLTPDSVHEQLHDSVLMPCLALCYSIVSFYYGITLGGGFSQIQYLGDIKRAWISVLSSVRDAEHEVSDAMPTDIFTGDFVIAGITDGTYTEPATLVDIYLWGDNSTQTKIEKLFAEVTIGETLDIMIPQLCHTLAPSSGPPSKLKDFPASLHVHT